MYTAEVSFTPLLNSPAIPLQEVSCAPKLAYMLSDKVSWFSLPFLPYTLPFQVGLLALRDLAFWDIKSKMNKENIAKELFSKFSSE